MFDDLFPTPAIDSAAANGGFSVQCRPLITGSNPQAILQHAAHFAEKMQAFANLLADLQRARDQLRQVWQSGAGADAAMRKLSQSFDKFAHTIETVNKFITELRTVASKLDLAKKACNAAIRVTEPVVAALLSNPWTHAAARAIATAVTTVIAAFLKAIAAILNEKGC